MPDERASALRLYLHLTMNCNLRCHYCYGGAKRRDTMPLQVGMDAIDYFMGQVEHHLLISFIGGEPLLEFEVLKALVAHAQWRGAARKLPISFVIVTNGTLLDRPAAEFCAAHGIEISLSLDGHEPAQDANRVFANGRGSFSTIDGHLGHIVDLLPTTHVVSVVHPDNIGELSQSVAYLLDRGFRSLALSPDYTHVGLQAALPELEKQLHRVGELYVERVHRGESIFINFLDEGRHIRARGACQLGARDLSVDPRGRIYPCCSFVDHDQLELGSVYEGIDEQKVAAFRVERARLQKQIAEIHKDCPALSFCRAGCGCTNLVSTGSMSTTHPATCEVGVIEERVRRAVLEQLEGAGAG